VESTVVRGRFERGTYTEIPALAPLVFASNRVLPKDVAFLRRLLVVRFTFGERIDPEKAKEFEEKVKPRLSKLQAVGMYAASRLIKEPDLLKKDWKEVAVRLLVEAYAAAGIEPPSWIGLEYSGGEDVHEDLREAVIKFLIERVNDEYAKKIGRISGDSAAEEDREEYFKLRCRAVLEHRLLPWAVVEKDTVYFRSPLAEELQPIIGDIGGLKSLAELMGWEYRVVKIGGRPTRTAATPLDSLLELLSGKIEAQR